MCLMIGDLSDTSEIRLGSTPIHGKCYYCNLLYVVESKWSENSLQWKRVFALFALHASHPRQKYCCIYFVHSVFQLVSARALTTEIILAVAYIHDRGFVHGGKAIRGNIESSNCYSTLTDIRKKPASTMVRHSLWKHSHSNPVVPK